MSAQTSASKAFDIGPPMEHGSWSAYQKFILLLVALAVVLDGFDNQVLGFALPALIKEWGVTRAAFAPIFALGFLGMAMGTAFGGWLGDRIGRRTALILSVSVFGIATGLTATADTVFHLGVCRVLAGFGLGGAMPCATTILSEFSPLRRRSVAVTMGIVCIPLGGVIGGLIAAHVLPQIGWRALFAIAGVLPVVIAGLLAIFLPESPRFLVRYPARWPQLARTMARLGHPAGADATFVDSYEPESSRKVAVGELFASNYFRDTAALWVAFFFCLLATYIVFSWAPTLLVDSGFDIAMSSTTLAVFNIGGVLGALAGALVINRIGSRLAMVGMAAGGVVGALALVAIPLGSADRSHVLIAMFVEGAFINAVQTTLYLLAANIYPVQMRATGVGGAAGFGRLGAIASSFIGVAVLSGGGKTYFAAIAASMAVALVGLAFVRRHSSPMTAIVAPASITPAVAE
jgi:AAHS family 4-hydroxybenzoate transporter-like MFS transporter